MFHFQIVRVESKKNVVADALSRNPHVSIVFIGYHHELDDMKSQYAADEDFARVYEQLSKKFVMSIIFSEMDS